MLVLGPISQHSLARLARLCLSLQVWAVRHSYSLHTLTSISASNGGHTLASLTSFWSSSPQSLIHTIHCSSYNRTQLMLSHILWTDNLRHECQILWKTWKAQTCNSCRNLQKKLDVNSCIYKYQKQLTLTNSEYFTIPSIRVSCRMLSVLLFLPSYWLLCSSVVHVSRPSVAMAD